MHRLRQSLNQSGYGDLVTHLGHLARATVPNPAAELGIDVHHWLSPVIVALISTTHDGKLAILGPGLTAGHRRVDKCDAFGLCCRIKLAGDGGGNSRMIHKSAALGH